MSTCARSARFGAVSSRVADFLFDTAFFIDLRRSSDSGAADLWQRLANSEITGSYSAVTAYELWVGRRFSREEEVFYLAAFSLLEEAAVTSAAAMSAGERLRNMPERTEKLFRDALIASTARDRGEVVVTRNVRDFAGLNAQVQAY